MKSLNFQAHFFAALSLAVPVFLYITHIHYLGFPDGHMTDLERAEKPLFIVFVCLSIACAINFFFIGLSARMQDKKRQLLIAIIIYGVAVIVIIIARCILGSCLENGVGG